MYGGATGSLATEPRTPGRRGVGVFTRPSLTSARSPPVAPSTRHALRDRADRSWSSAGSGVPVVGEPGLGEESSGDDDGVGQRDECLDHASAALGAEGEFAKAAVVPGVGPLDHPAAARLEGEALVADHAVAAELIEQVAGLARVVAGVEMDGDVVGQADAHALIEAGELVQRGSQQRGVVAVRAGHDAANWDPGRLSSDTLSRNSCRHVADLR